MRSPFVPLLLSAFVILLSLAGCLQRNGDDGGGQGNGEPYYQSNPEYGLVIEPVALHNDVQVGSDTTWRFRAENTGEPGGNSFSYLTNCGDQPWRPALTGPDGKDVDWHEPGAECQGGDERELKGGESVDYSWSWDGRVWSGGGFVDAPKGQYTLRVTFDARHEGIHPSDANGVTRFDVA